MHTIQNTTGLIAPKGACSFSLDGRPFEIPESRIVMVPTEHADMLIRDQGFMRCPWTPMPDPELSKLVHRRTHLEERQKDLEASIAKAEKSRSDFSTNLTSQKDGLAEGKADVHQVAETSSKLQAQETMLDTLKTALGAVERELSEIVEEVRKEELGREALLQEAAAVELREKAEQIVSEFVEAVIAPRAHLERLAALAQDLRRKYPLAKGLPLLEIPELARQVEASWLKRNPGTAGANILPYVHAILFGPVRTDKSTWPERFHVRPTERMRAERGVDEGSGTRLHW